MRIHRKVQPPEGLDLPKGRLDGATAKGQAGDERGAVGSEAQASATASGACVGNRSAQFKGSSGSAGHLQLAELCAEAFVEPRQ
jgi:hypothetical protein